MTCSEAREALSAWYDGEGPALAPGVRVHVAECDECAAFERTLDRVGDVVARAAIPATTVPDLAPRVVRRAGRRRRVIDRSLQWAVGLAGVVELATTLYYFVRGDDDAGHGTAHALAHAMASGHAAHEGHEAVALTVAVCVALLCAAFRPRFSRPYLPVLGVATLLMVVASVHDVDHRVVSVGHELRHTGLLVGFLLLCLVAARQPRDPARTGLLLAWRRPHEVERRLRVVSRSAATAYARIVRPLAPGASRCWPARWARIAAATALAAGLVLVAGPAEAHAVLEESSPGSGAVVQHAPATVVLRFDEPVTLLPTSLQVIGPDGRRVDDGAVDHDGDRTTTAAVGLSDATRKGTYLVSWRVVSADSHPVSGAFTFSVGRPGEAPTAPATSSNRGVGIGLGVGRWLGYAGSALLVGGLLFLVACRPRAEGRGVRRLLLLGAGLVGIGAVVCLLLKGPYDADLGAGHLVDGTLLREVLGTTYGAATLGRIALALLGALLVLGRSRLSPGARVAATGVLTVALAVCFALAGHAAAASPRWLAVVVDGVHVVAMSVWLGGLAMLLALVVRHRGEDAMAVARRFSALALGAVVALAATGAYQAWRETRSWGALQHTTYGRELIVKLVVVVLILAVAASSRALVWRHADLSGLRRTVALEAVGVVAVLGVTSALVATEPASAAYHPSVDANLTILGDTVQVSAIPNGDRSMELHVYVFGRSGEPAEPKQLSATVADGALGPLPVTLAKAGPGHRQGVVSVPRAGDWTLAVTLRTSAIDQDSADVTLPIR
ncbi:copper resistance protein CopC [Nocardioides sp. DS6]|uniref:Copper resistance protein CopC n=1 Tax=Nocardioides eburneus TaxID=3231482 RepID=A0ABV3T3S4_9ACTN